MIVYKYRQNSEYTDKIFTSQKVWLSTPAALNDPFETEITFGENYTESVVKKRAQQVAAFLASARSHRKAGKPFFGLSKKDIYSLLERFKNLRDGERAYAAFSDFITQKTGASPLNIATIHLAIPDQLASIGIFSLSETSDNSLMWAHYGGDHQGICIGFEVTDTSALANSEHCLHVKYSDAAPIIEDVIEMDLQMAIQKGGQQRKEGAISLSHPFVQATIATKGMEWEYEREWRYVEFSSGEFDWPAPIVEITFGLRCTQGQRDHYKKLAEAFVPNDVRIYEIQKIPGTKLIKRVMLHILGKSLPGNVTEPSIELVQELMDKRQFTAATTLIEKLISAQKNMSEALRCKGIALGWAENHIGALGCFDQALSIDSNNFSLHYQKAVALTALGQYDESVEEYKIAQNLCEWEHSFPFNQGAILFHLNRPEEALVQMKRAKYLGHPRANDMIATIERYLANAEQT